MADEELTRALRTRDRGDILGGLFSAFTGAFAPEQSLELAQTVRKRRAIAGASPYIAKQLGVTPEEARDLMESGFLSYLQKGERQPTELQKEELKLRQKREARLSTPRQKLPSSYISTANTLLKPQIGDPSPRPSQVVGHAALLAQQDRRQDISVKFTKLSQSFRALETLPPEFDDIKLSAFDAFNQGADPELVAITALKAIKERQREVENIRLTR